MFQRNSTLTNSNYWRHKPNQFTKKFISDTLITDLDIKDLIQTGVDQRMPDRSPLSYTPTNQTDGKFILAG